MRSVNERTISVGKLRKFAIAHWAIRSGASLMPSHLLCAVFILKSATNRQNGDMGRVSQFALLDEFESSRGKSRLNRLASGIRKT
jgi:hypothetical protein